jgi:hypothetical protein
MEQLVSNMNNQYVAATPRPSRLIT